MKKKSRIPKFNSYAEEAEWWDTHSVSDYWDEFTPVKLIYKPAKKASTLAVRLDLGLKKQVDALAYSQGLSPSTLVRMWMVEHIRSQKMAPASVKVRKASKSCP